MPLFQLYQYSNVVGCKTIEPIELGTFYILYVASVQIISEHVFFFRSDLVWQSYAPFFTRPYKPCQHDILRTA